MNRTQHLFPCFSHSYFKKKLKKYLIWLPTLILLSLLLQQQAQAQTYIDFSTYIGGAGAENTFRKKVVDGKVHILGNSTSANFPVTNDALYGGSTDLIYMQLDAKTGTILFSTYIGGTGTDQLADLEVVDGKVHILATTASTDYPVTNNTSGGTKDMVYTQLDATTGEILHSTYLGGSGAETPYDLEVANGAVYIVGITTSTDFPVTNTSTYVASFDYVITKIDITTGTIQFSTYLAGTGVDHFATLKIAEGLVHLIGFTTSTDLPVTDASINSGGYDFIYTQLDSLNGDVVFATYFGGTGLDRVDSILGFEVMNGVVHFVGQSTSTDYPVTNGSTHGGGPQDLVYTQFEVATGAMLYSSYLGGSEGELRPNYKVADGRVHIISATSSVDYPVTNGSISNGSYDFAYTQLDASTGAILFSTFIGGNDDEYANIHPDLEIVDGILHLVGESTSPDYPVTNGSTPVKADIVYTKLDIATGAILFSTFIGGSDAESSPFISVVDSIAHIVASTAAEDYPVTDGSSIGRGADFVYTRLPLCVKNVLVSSSAITPATQTTCQFGLAAILDASPVIVPSDSMPLLYINGTTTSQGEITLNYQWQIADSPTGPWEGLTAGILEDYQPSVGGTDQYYRRITQLSPCCGSMGIDTTDVAAVLVNANIAPTVDAGGVFHTCSDTTLTIGDSPTATGGLSPYTYTWDNGAAAIANPAVSPSVPTIYTLTVTDDLGCQQIDQAVVQTYVADAAEDESFCEGSSGIRIGTSPISGLTGVVYSWSPVDSLTCTDCARPLATPTSITDYMLSLTIPITGGGTCTTLDTVTITPISAPTTPNFAGPEYVICLGDLATLGEASEPNFSYTWAPGNYLTSNNMSTTTFQSGNLEMPIGNPITYYVTAEHEGCTFVDDAIVAVIEARAGEDGCGPRYVGERDRTPNIEETYAWTKVSGPGDFTGVTNLPQVPVSSSGAGTTIYALEVSYELNGVLGICRDTVVVPPCGCVVEIITTAPFDCPSFDLNNGNVTLTAVAGDIFNNDPDAFGYAWEVIDGPSGGLSSFTDRIVTLTDTIARTFQVTMSSPFDPSFSCTDIIEVNHPAWSLPVFTAQDATVCSGDTAQLGQATVVGYGYEWSPEDDLFPSSLISNPSVIGGDNKQNYIVTVTDIGSGCTTKDTATITIQNPAADAGLDWLVCDNALIKLGTSVERVHQIYYWTPILGTYENGTNQLSRQPEFIAATDLTFYLEVTDTITGCMAYDTAMVVVNNSPSITDFPDTTMCFGDDAILIGSPALPNVAYSWSPTNGLSCSDCAQPLANPDATTVYTVTATFPGNCNNIATDFVTLTVYDPSFTMADIDFCPSNGAVALGGDAPAGLSTYLWSPTSQVDDASIRETITLDPPPSTATVYTLTVTDANGCKASSDVTINPSQSPPLAGSNQLICLNETTTLGSASNPTGANITYTWSPSTGLNDANSPNPIFTPPSAGTYNFTLTKEDSGLSCTSTADVSVTVETYTLPIIDYPNICQGACVQIGPSPDFGVQYIWTPSNNLSDTTIANPLSCGLTETTTYTLTAIGTNGCVATEDVIVGVAAVPAPTISMADTTECLGAATTHFNPSVSPSANYDYDWSPTIGLSDPYVLNPTVNIQGAGTTTYTLTATNTDNGCNNQKSADLIVEACPLPCDLEIYSVTALPCDAATNTYSLVVEITYENPPVGNIIIATDHGDTFSIAQSGSPQSLTLTGLVSDGTADIDVTAFFENDETCPFTIVDTYTAPDYCFCPTLSVVHSQQCFDNETGGNVNDDYFVLSLTANAAQNTPSNQYEILVGADVLATATYGNTVVLEWQDAAQTSRFASDGTTTYEVVIRDVDSQLCDIVVETVLESNCSVCPSGICLPVKTLVKRGSGTN